jgi:hypothetical protein
MSTMISDFTMVQMQYAFSRNPASEYEFGALAGSDHQYYPVS